MATDTAELGIRTQEESNKQSSPQINNESVSTAPKRKLSFISPRALKLKAIAIGRELPLDKTRPPAAESLFAPIAGNMFGEGNHTKAAKMIEKFVAERKIGKGFVKGAVESETEGVTFAFEPNDQEIAIWQQVSGSSQPGSFNAYLATLAIPRYLDRISFAHFRNKNNDQAKIFMAESDRVNKIIRDNSAV